MFKPKQSRSISLVFSPNSWVFYLSITSLSIRLVKHFQIQTQSTLNIKIIQTLSPMESNHPSMSLNNGRDDEIFDSNSQERSFPIEIEETDFERQFIEIFERIERLEAEVFPEMEEASQRKVPGKKKIRRRAREILKKFKCGDAACGKRYGSRSSSKNQVKIKHNIPKNEVNFDREKEGIIIVKFNYRKSQPIKRIN